MGDAIKQSEETIAFLHFLLA
ncbi:MAG: hypothetical protein K0R67_3915, partial [Paenibacillus sp.]|nr:hypothetical protein [Paenibacillus sp.]